MKKLAAILALILAICALMSSCGTAGEATQSETTEEVTTEADTTAVNTRAEYDENGKYILTSTEDRYVFGADDGYVVFTFNGGYVIGVTSVMKFSDNEEAREYFNENKATLDADENYSHPFLNENHIILPCTAFSEPYGHYIRGGTRDDVDKEFPPALRK